MRVIDSRIQRIFGTVQDPVSYRLLWCGLTNQLVSVPSENLDSDEPTDLGWPIDGPAANDGWIPKIVFQPWTSRSELPSNYRYWRRSFYVQNPDHRFFFWDESDNREFVSKWFPWYLPVFDGYPRGIFRTNITRFFFLFIHGGFSVHIDSECLRPMANIRGCSDVLLGRMGRDNSFEHSVQNAFMASKPYQAFWLLAIAMAVERFAQNHSDIQPEWSTGPVLLRDAAEFYLTSDRQGISDRISRSCSELASELRNSDFGRLKIASPEFFCPINWNNFATTFFRRQMMKKNCIVPSELALKIFPRTYVVTYWCEPSD